MTTRRPKYRTYKDVWDRNGTIADLTADMITQIVADLYKLKLAEPFFIGMGWPEGYSYCQSSSYTRGTFAMCVKQARNGEDRAIWFAIGLILRTAMP